MKEYQLFYYIPFPQCQPYYDRDIPAGEVCDVGDGVFVSKDYIDHEDRNS